MLMDVHVASDLAGSADEPVMTLTDRAVEMVKTAMQRENRGAEYALRVGVVGGGCSGFSYEQRAAAGAVTPRHRPAAPSRPHGASGAA